MKCRVSSGMSGQDGRQLTCSVALNKIRVPYWSNIDFGYIMSIVITRPIQSFLTVEISEEIAEGSRLVDWVSVRRRWGRSGRGDCLFSRKVAENHVNLFT